MTTLPTRVAIRGWFADVLAGRRTPDEAGEWAVDHIEAGRWEEELILQGLLRLNALPGSSDARTKESLERWAADLAEYDEDPQEWDRQYCLELVRVLPSGLGSGVRAGSRTSW